MRKERCSLNIAMAKFAVNKEELKSRLTPLEYEVTQESFTEA